MSFRQLAAIPNKAKGKVAAMREFPVTSSGTNICNGGRHKQESTLRLRAQVSVIIDVRNVIMPYVVLKDGRTLAEHVSPRMEKLMEMETTERLLTA